MSADIHQPVPIPVLLHPLTVVERFDDLAARIALDLRRHRPANRLMYTLSMLGDDGKVWVAASGIEALRSPDAPRRFRNALVWLAVESAVVNGPVKWAVRRSRPVPLTRHEYRLRIPTDTSFPSGHAASAATMAVILSEDSPLAPLWVALALGIGLSRVHVGVHHGSDVAAGWLFGIGFGLVARAVSPRRPAGPASTGDRPTTD